MSDERGNVHPIEIKLRGIDRKRLDSLQERTETALSSSDNIWYIHTVLAQCFLPYTDQKDIRDWKKQNGKYSIILTAGVVNDPRNPKGLLDRKSTRLNSSHIQKSRMPSSA